MKITIFGTGYVGLVSGVCFAHLGHDVVCVDTDQSKIARLRNGETPIYEPGLTEILLQCIQNKKIHFTTDSSEGVKHGLFQFIAVGTPADKDGSADLKYVLDVAETIGSHMNDYRIIITKSTVPVGTSKKIFSAVQQMLAKRKVAVSFDVVSNPEFLKEGNAIKDFLKPDRVIIGTETEKAYSAMQQLYAPLNLPQELLINMDIASAELTKYASNAFLATKISFMNEISQLAEKLGADIEQVRQGMSYDQRIGRHFLYAGCGYGGSCFPKDVNALISMGRDLDHPLSILCAVDKVNMNQKKILFKKISDYFHGNLSDKTIALWGLAFKPNTDDMREASSRILMEALWQAGAKIKAFDPVAMMETKRIYGERSDLQLCESQDLVLEEADVLVIVTEWPEFYKVDFDEVKAKLKYSVIFDGRNMYDPQEVSKCGITYIGIGRSAGVDVVEYVGVQHAESYK